jgi:hypothetical protein
MTPIFSASGQTWLENETDGRRRARVLFQDGSLRVVDCAGVADTWFSISCRARVAGHSVQGFVTSDSETGEFLFNPMSGEKALLKSLLGG